MFQNKIGTADAAPEGAVTAGGSGPAPMLRSAMTCVRLRVWVKLAQPNARLTYGEGNLLRHACIPQVADLVMALAAKGLLTPHFVRGREGEPSRYIVQRTQRPYIRGMEL
jgi:hypothetical protein